MYGLLCCSIINNLSHFPALTSGYRNIQFWLLLCWMHATFMWTNHTMSVCSKYVMECGYSAKVGDIVNANIDADLMELLCE